MVAWFKCEVFPALVRGSKFYTKGSFVNIQQYFAEAYVQEPKVWICAMNVSTQKGPPYKQATFCQIHIVQQHYTKSVLEK